MKKIEGPKMTFNYAKQNRAKRKKKDSGMGGRGGAAKAISQSSGVVGLS